MVWAVSLFPGPYNDADAGRTDVSVDPARRQVRTAADVPSRRRRQRPRRRSTALRLSLQPPLQRQRRHDSDTSRRFRFPTSSRRTDRLTLQLLLTTATSTLSDIVRRADAAPCVLRATANWNRSSQLTVAAALTTRNSTSPNKSLRLSALYLSAHCRALSQHAEHMRRLHTLFVARLFYSCLTLQQTCVINAV